MMQDVPFLVVLAGGAGTRLWPLSEKSLIPFMGKPILLHQLELFRELGFGKGAIVVNPANREAISRLLTRSDIGIEMSIVTQPEPKGMGDALLQLADLLAEHGNPPIYVNQVHDVVEPELHRAMLAAYRSGRATSYLAGYRVDEYFPGGYLIVDETGRVEGMIEKPEPGTEPSDLVSIVAHVHTDPAALMDAVRAQYRAGVTTDDHYERAMAILMSEVRYQVVRYDGKWCAIKYPWHVLDVMFMFLDGISGRHISERALIGERVLITGDVVIEDGVRVFPGAAIVGPAYIGQGTIVGNNALVRQSMIGRNCNVGFATEVARSYIGDGCQMHTCRALDSVLAENVNLSAGCTTANLRIDRGEVHSVVKGRKVGTGRRKLGAIIGRNAFISVHTATMPGVKIGRSAEIGPMINVMRDVPDGVRVMLLQRARTLKPAPVNPHIFRSNDIRGRAGDDLTPDMARRIGRAFGTWLLGAGYDSAIVGRDNRLSSPELAEALIEGLASTGCRVADLGMVATPVLYYAATRDGDVPGVMVTGSHLPPDRNGFKLCIGRWSLFGDRIAALRRIVESHDFAVGPGSVERWSGIADDYLEAVAEAVDGADGIRIVIDAGNGMAGLYAPDLLNRLGYEVDCLFCEPDGSFPNHQPDPQRRESLSDLRDAVLRSGADLGIAFDGDMDRIGVVDDRGEVVSVDRLLILLAREVLKYKPGAPVVADVLSTQALFDEVERLGGFPVIWKSGYALIKEKMIQIDAPLGGEMSGHVFLADRYYGYDDALYAAARLLNLIASDGRSLSEIMAELPALFATPEYRPHCPDDRKFAIVEAVKARLADRYPILDVDGIRITFERGWGLLRASNTEPALSLRFEADSEAEAMRYKDILARELRAFPEVGAW